MSALCTSSPLPQAPDRPLLLNVRKPAGSARVRSSTTPNSGRAPSSRIARKDWNLIQQALRGDSQAQHDLFSTHAARLYRTAYVVLWNQEDAEDAVQISLCNAFINLRSFKGRSSFSTWLNRIVINSTLIIRRKRTAHVQTSLDEMMDDQPERLLQKIVYAGLDPEELCVTGQLDELLSERVRRLPPPIRDACQLYFLKGFSAVEACQVLGIGNSALKGSVFRGRRMLADALRQTMRSDLTRKNWSIRQMAGVGSSPKHSDTSN